MPRQEEEAKKVKREENLRKENWLMKVKYKITPIIVKRFMAAGIYRRILWKISFVTVVLRKDVLDDKNKQPFCYMVMGVLS